MLQNDGCPELFKTNEEQGEILLKTGRVSKAITKEKNN